MNEFYEKAIERLRDDKWLSGNKERAMAPAVREALEQQGLSFLSADVKMIPRNTVSITDEETAAKIEKLLDMLDDNDDVADVYHNAELPESDEEDE